MFTYYSSISFGFLIIIIVSITNELTTVYGYQETHDSTKNQQKQQKQQQQQQQRTMYGRDCDASYSITCLKLDVVSFIEKLSDKKEYNILPGISVVKEINASDPKTSEIVAEIARSFPNDAEKRLNGYLLAKLGNFLQSHTLRLKLMDKTTAEEARAVFTGRAKGGGIGGGGKKGGMEGILAAGMMMKGTLFAIATGALAMLAGKALMTGMMALMLSAIVGIKALTSHHGKSTTYEIIAKPVYATSHSHSVSHEDIHGHGGGGGHGHSGFGGYGRSINLALPEHLTKA